MDAARCAGTVVEAGDARPTPRAVPNEQVKCVDDVAACVEGQGRVRAVEQAPESQAGSAGLVHGGGRTSCQHVDCPSGN